MPTKSKCMSCGETAYLSGITVKHDQDGHYEFWMVCGECRRYYVWKGTTTRTGNAPRAGWFME